MRLPLETRFWLKVKVINPTDCWEWQATKNKQGYGLFSDRHGHWILAHRFAFQLVKGNIPEGLTLDHLCRNHSCCNPAHLEAVAIGENVRRGIGTQLAAQRQRDKTHCPQGHPYNEANTYIAPNGARHCRLCRIESKHHSRSLLQQRGLSTRGHPLCLDNPCSNLRYR